MWAWHIKSKCRWKKKMISRVWESQSGDAPWKAKPRFLAFFCSSMFNVTIPSSRFTVTELLKHQPLQCVPSRKNKEKRERQNLPICHLSCYPSKSFSLYIHNFYTKTINHSTMETWLSSWNHHPLLY